MIPKLGRARGLHKTSFLGGSWSLSRTLVKLLATFRLLGTARTILIDLTPIAPGGYARFSDSPANNYRGL